MASLRSMILDGHPISIGNNNPESLKFYLNSTVDALRSHDTILVNNTPIVESLPEETIAKWELIPCPKPPYPIMWLEHSREGQRNGTLVKREDNADSTHVRAVYWVQVDDVIWLDGIFVYALNDRGDYQKSHRELLYPPKDNTKDPIDSLLIEQWFTFHTFARMNCHNVKLVPMTAGAPKIKPGAKHPPYSVWHEIKVTGLSELRQAQTETQPDGEKREVRFHKVRGHYADYTKGKGLFGRLKVRIWIDEHAAGNPDMGTVTSSYTVSNPLY